MGILAQAILGLKSSGSICFWRTGVSSIRTHSRGLAAWPGSCPSRAFAWCLPAQSQTCRRRHGTPGQADSDQPWDQWKCNEVTDQMVCSEPEPEVEARSLPSLGKIGWPSDGPIKASDLWCKINVPAADWRLKTCPGDGALSVKMISYNLFWWNLFSRHDGGGKSAGKLIARTSGDDLYDFMGFQECDDRDRVMGEAES